MNRRIKCQRYNRITGMICGRPATREAKVEVPSAHGKIWETLDVCQPHGVAMRAELVKTIAYLEGLAREKMELELNAGGSTSVSDNWEPALRARRALDDLNQVDGRRVAAQKAERAEIARRDRVEIINLIARMGR